MNGKYALRVRTHKVDAGYPVTSAELNQVLVLATRKNSSGKDKTTVELIKYGVLF
jgi:hypothetical protein